MYANRICSVANCDAPFYCRGFCTKHYQRVTRLGRLGLRDTAERLAAKSVIRESGCIEWKGAHVPSGHGRIFHEGRVQYAHRVAWQLQRGPIPDEMVIDHLCCNPPCVNVEHLRVTTHKINSLAGTSPPAKNAVKTHCLRGHAFDTANTWIDRHGYRACRACAKFRKHQPIS